MRSELGRDVSRWCSRLDRAFSTLQRNNLLVRVDKRRRDSHVVVTLVSFDLNNIRRVNCAKATPGGCRRKPIVRACEVAEGVIAIPVEYGDIYGASKLWGVDWVARVELFDGGRAPEVSFSTRRNRGKITEIHIDVENNSKTIELLLEYMQRSAAVPPLADPARYVTKVKLMNLPEISTVPAIITNPNWTYRDASRFLSEYLGITVAGQYGPLVVKDILELPTI